MANSTHNLNLIEKALWNVGYISEKAGQILVCVNDRTENLGSEVHVSVGPFGLLWSSQ